ncbi:MAG: Nramp family divalent metal transporter, partial [Candidatus Omnitrophica bacterium]|nr:Nramp family divalent metal transporter [Candidatus Omnitrophota bacterium]
MKGGLPSPKSESLISFPGWWAALGPGVVWLALAQGSGELIWWPYLVSKYGLYFLFLLIPACLLQLPLNFHIGNYTLATGESIFQGFIRLNRVFAFGLWILMSVSFAWFGAYASAGGTALAALTGFPAGWSTRGQTLFWAYATMALFLGALLVGRVVYRVVERFMWGVAVITFAGLVFACVHPSVVEVVPDFLKGLVSFRRSLPASWDPSDSTKLLTAITFAGLGGFWTLFYSYWLKEKGAGMAAKVPHMAGLLSGHVEESRLSGAVPQAEPALQGRWRSWRRFLLVDSSVGIWGNILTTLMTCLLSYALLSPAGLLPKDYELSVVQSRFFELQWGWTGRALFLAVAAAFLSDTWLATADAVARINTDITLSFFPAARRLSVRSWYYLWLAWLTLVTGVT